MQKQAWIAAKTKHLIEVEHKSPSQAFAMANKMWEEEHGKALSVPTLSFPILTVGKTKNPKYTITKEIYDQVLASYDPPNVHEAPARLKKEDLKNFASVVDVPHDVKTTEDDALGFVRGLREEEINGKPWILADVVPADDKAAVELNRILSGPKKNNSPELELWTPDFTQGWPGKADGKWHLKRVNMLGETPPAQFGMPQAFLALSMDTEGMDLAYSIKDLYQNPLISGEVMKKKCGNCGYEMEAGEKVCQKCGAKMEFSLSNNNGGTMGDTKVTPPPLPAAAAGVTLEQFNELKSTIEKLVTDNKNLAIELSTERSRNTKTFRAGRDAQVEQMVLSLRDSERVVIPAQIENGLIPLAQWIDNVSTAAAVNEIKLSDGTAVPPKIKLSAEKEADPLTIFLDVLRVGGAFTAPLEKHFSVHGPSAGKAKATNEALIQKHLTAVREEMPKESEHQRYILAVSRAEKESTWDSTVVLTPAV